MQQHNTNNIGLVGQGEQGQPNNRYFSNTGVQQSNQAQHITRLSDLPNSVAPHKSQDINHSQLSGGHHDALNNSHAHGHSGHAASHYNPLQMPCDWEIARKHALSRRTATEQKEDPNNPKHVETCPCCGFEVERDDIPYCSDPMALSFLGSGFTLFYNYLRYCIIILFIQLLIKQLYNLYSNYEGDYCEEVKNEKIGGHVISLRNCPDNIFLRLSLANKINQKDAFETMQILNFISITIIMVVLIYFRKSQRQIDTTIDEMLLTPADYTICVKNIPTGQKVDYKWELTNIFENYATLGCDQKIIVRKVVLVYDIEDIIKKEQQLDELIEQKKEAIKQHNYDFHHESVQHVDEKIEHLEHEIHKIEEEYQKYNTKFAGIAFVSFDDESMKQLVLSQNPHTQWERTKSFWNNGKLDGLNDQEDLSWLGQKLFLEQAPEPNDVDWEFIHVTTTSKISKRLKAWFYYILIESAAFFGIYLISHEVALYGDIAREEFLKGKLDTNTMSKINIMSFAISFTIVLFNKFAVAKIVHYIVDDEKISNKTKFQISFVYKYALALFLNAAIISFLVDIVILKNVYGAGGFIQNESQIFVLNAIFPPIVWFVDPWSLCKNIWRWYLKRKGDKALLTQQEANKLMEEPDYLSAKRYSDVMKTMWFTFLYGTAIPLGTLFSAFGILIYYFVDYYNILRRRTVKESISIQLSTEMIEMLEWIISWCAFGSMIMTYTFYKEINTIDICLIIMALIYQQLPMEDISEYFFPVVNNEEIKPYDEGSAGFDTDYDRENPVTKHEAIAEWNKKMANKQLAQNQEFGYKGDGHYALR